MSRLVFALLLGALSGAGAWADQNVYKGEEPVMVDSNELEWQPAASLGGGAEMAIIEGDPAKKEPFTLRLRLPDGLELAPHTHPEDERVTVLEGTLHLAPGEEFSREDTEALEPGAMALMPAGEPMYGYAEGETVIQLHGTGPWGIDYLNASDDPREEKQ
ncbi:cupin [Proteobacteria bacterium 005FR1]|nr:cupin [Proteobacteria bacterium 005FR1]